MIYLLQLVRIVLLIDAVFLIANMVSISQVCCHQLVFRIYSNSDSEHEIDLALLEQDIGSASTTGARILVDEAIGDGVLEVTVNTYLDGSYPTHQVFLDDLKT